MESPPEGLWSVASSWEDGWPGTWQHAQISKVESQPPWTLVYGELEMPGGVLRFRDAYKQETQDGKGELFRVLRRFEWLGNKRLEEVTLSLRWQVPGATAGRPFLPGILYYGNPSGAKTNPAAVIVHSGKPGDRSICEEHRFTAPFACIEWQQSGAVYHSAALHTLPTPVPGGKRKDQWWSLGIESHETFTELISLSGPCAMNGGNSMVKATQAKAYPYQDAWMNLEPGAVVEKTFFIQNCPKLEKGAGFVQPLQSAIKLHGPIPVAGMPAYDEILREKWKFALTRLREHEAAPGFAMHEGGNDYVMGWCGQAAAPTAAILRLADRLDAHEAIPFVCRTLDHLSHSPFNDQGFLLAYNSETGKWSGQDPVSQGQAMENFALAIEAARELHPDLDRSRWEGFLERACEIHARRILDDGWQPVSTAEGFFVSPLARGFGLFGREEFRRAALKAADHYRQRHLDMSEPYWGGTLDARCEDKEGAVAGLLAFMAAHQLTEDNPDLASSYLTAATHALYTVLSYTQLTDCEFPAGRLRDHAFDPRGWTMVSAQNQHLNVFAVLVTPQIWRMGVLLDRPELKRLAKVMFRSCGQLIDPRGSQGEQINHTNFSQRDVPATVDGMRGSYSETWTVFWITAHFLNAAGQFEAMGVDLGAK